MTALAAMSAALAVTLLLPAGPRLPARGVVPPPASRDAGLLRRHRVLVSGLAGAGAWVFVGGLPGVVALVLAAVAAHVVIGRAEPADVRRERERVRAELPHVVSLLATALRGGLAPPAAVHLVTQALPGPTTDRLRRLQARLDLGGDPESAWADLARDSDLAPLGRAMSRAHRSGAPVVTSVERLADTLAGRARAEIEDRARVVGVRAAVPLGLCLLPAFLLIGIVPVVAGLLGDLTL